MYFHNELYDININMCGISAVFGKYPEKDGFMRQSLSKIEHRGTSFYEYQIFENGALGANRLPIVGRLAGQQPLSNEDGTIFAAQNGEIFNYKELRKNLEAKGYKFKTDCDTEVLAHLYEEYGEKMINHIDSEMYAFVVYDTKNNSFFAAKDRFGVKPMYFGRDKEGAYYFASELKQLTQFEHIESIENFPKGHYMVDGVLKSYYEMGTKSSVKNENEAVRHLTKLVVEAVRKRVDTDLPVAVLFSGGVDSSLIMEIANRLHPNVTAFILGRPGAPDYEAAMRLCKDYGYKYQVVYPDVDYAKEYKDVIYHLELYEAQVIRQAFALDILSKEIVRSGFRIALAGDASDEIFGGYNEFARLAAKDINKGCQLIAGDLERSHNVRLDRMSMKHTLEVRAPFFDTDVVNYAMKLDPSLKVRKENHQVTVKYILRKVAEQFLPEYISYRYKVPFSNGAGMNVGFNFRTQDGDVAKSVLATGVTNSTSEAEVKKYGFLTEEEKIYFSLYKGFGYTKLKDNERRIVTKETLSQIDSDKASTRLIVAEFDKLPLYFPLYLGNSIGLYEKRDLAVDYISTGGDDLTYNALFSGSAQIGVSDPVFSFSKTFTTKGKIIAGFVDRIPLVAVTFDPSMIIEKKCDLNKYRVGSFQEFSTTHALSAYFLDSEKVIPFPHKELSQALTRRKVDVAIMTIDLALELVEKGGRIVFSFENEYESYLFTGLTTCDNLDPSFAGALDKVVAVVRESITYIEHHPKQALAAFKKEFPSLLDHKRTLEALVVFWNKKMDVDTAGVTNAERVWDRVHPELLKTGHARFFKVRPEDKVVAVLSQGAVSRDVPYQEDKLSLIVRECIAKNEPIPVVMFWGASDKKGATEADVEALDKLVYVANLVKKIYQPGVALTLLLANKHAEVNGFDTILVNDYLKRISELAKERSLNTEYLSNIWEKHGLTVKNVQDKALHMTEKEWGDVLLRQRLEMTTLKKGYSDARGAARAYYIMRTSEAPLIEAGFPRSIFATYSDDSTQDILPSMPTLYLWVNKKGHGELPWFEKTK